MLHRLRPSSNTRLLYALKKTPCYFQSVHLPRTTQLLFNHQLLNPSLYPLFQKNKHRDAILYSTLDAFARAHCLNTDTMHQILTESSIDNFIHEWFSYGMLQLEYTEAITVALKKFKDNDLLDHDNMTMLLRDPYLSACAYILGQWRLDTKFNLSLLLETNHRKSLYQQIYYCVHHEYAPDHPLEQYSVSPWPSLTQEYFENCLERKISFKL